MTDAPLDPAPAKDRAAATRPGEMDEGDAVLAAISSGSGQPRHAASAKPYVLSDTHRHQLLLLLAGLGLGYLAWTLIGRAR